MNINEVFEDIANQYPSNTALVWKGEKVTYHQLDGRVNFLAHHLIENGLESGEIVALDISRTVEMIIAMLAILKCGAAYYPMDDANPVGLSLSCLDSAAVKIIIGPPTCSEVLLENRKLISTKNKTLFKSSLSRFSGVCADVEDRAYVMFTSGSTGTPKGVVVPHRAVTRLVIDTNYINIEPRDNIFQLAPFSFDASTFEIWGALLNGATLVLYSGTVLDPNLLKREIAENNVSIAWLTAALFHLIAENYLEALRPLKVLLAGGDILNASTINKVLDYIPNIRVINGYGPTENTTFTCCHVMTTGNRPDKYVLIGKPISGTSVHVVDDENAHVQTGDIGEIVVSGRGVALGYLNPPKKNSAFFRDEKIADGLLYRTGDLVRENQSGEIEFIGRKDNQIKIRGYRVSLEEIKRRIMDIEGVNDAIVVCRNLASGDRVLVSYILKNGIASVCEASIKLHLQTVLPKYMIPGKFFFDTKLPMTRNGKLDKNALDKYF